MEKNKSQIKELEGMEPIIEQFKTLREEIHLRVKQHSQMVIFKVISLGAFVSFIVEKVMLPVIGQTQSSSIDKMQYIIWLVPLLAVVFDSLIAGNLRSMYNIGPYIKKYIEPAFKKFCPVHLQFWEETVATASSKYYCYTVPDLIIIWIFTIAPTMVIIAIRLASGLKIIDYFGIFISISASIFSLRHLIHSIKMKRTF